MAEFFPPGKDLVADFIEQIGACLNAVIGPGRCCLPGRFYRGLRLRLISLGIFGDDIRSV